MKKKNTQNMMKAVGTTLAVCSAAAFLSCAKPSNKSAKKTIMKTADKVVGFMDTVSSMM